MNAEQIFSELWTQYSDENPSAKKIHELFVSEGEQIINDHVAFRTFNDPRVDIGVLARPFINAGYHESGSYHFPAKKLFAKHFENHEQPGMPRVFISQLLLEEFSPDLQDAVKLAIGRSDPRVLNSDRLIVSGNVFGMPSFDVYSKLREESEYAAWVYVYGFRANHFTVSINHLKKYDTIEKVNEFLKSNGFQLNSSGGEIKGTPRQLLEQSSTLADRIETEFQEGTYTIPACYYEFARRYANNEGQLFSGFIAGSADKIFESTDFRK